MAAHQRPGGKRGGRTGNSKHGLTNILTEPGRDRKIENVSYVVYERLVELPWENANNYRLKEAWDEELLAQAVTVVVPLRLPAFFLSFFFSLFSVV